MRSYRDLVVWQEGMALAEASYGIANRLPEDERFGLVSQMRRAAVSIPANIAEGHGRGSSRAYANHVGIARGSLRELETHILLAMRLHRADAEECESVLADCDRLGRKLYGLIKSLTETASRSPDPAPRR